MDKPITRKVIEEASKWHARRLGLQCQIDRLKAELDKHLTSCKHWTVMKHERATAEDSAFTRCEWCHKEWE